MATRAGKIKKTELAAFSNVRASGIIAIDIAEGDDLYAVRLSDGNSDIFVGKAGGRVIRFNESEVRPMGRGAAGVRAVALREDDHVVEMDVLPAGAIVEDDVETEEVETEPRSGRIGGSCRRQSRGYIFTVTENGFGKRTPVVGVPDQAPRRLRRHRHQDDGAQRQGRRHGGRFRRGSGPAHHRAGDDHPRAGVVDLAERTQHSGRAGGQASTRAIGWWRP